MGSVGHSSGWVRGKSLASWDQVRTLHLEVMSSGYLISSYGGYVTSYPHMVTSYVALLQLQQVRMGQKAQVAITIEAMSGLLEYWETAPILTSIPGHSVGFLVFESLFSRILQAPFDSGITLPLKSVFPFIHKPNSPAHPIMLLMSLGVCVYYFLAFWHHQLPLWMLCKLWDFVPRPPVFLYLFVCPVNYQET